MPRRQPFSAKKKKAQLQAKRAQGRDEDASAPTAPKQKTKRRVGRSDLAKRQGAGEGNSGGGRLALESRFVSLPPQYLEVTRSLAFATTLQRPLEAQSAAFPPEMVTILENTPAALSVPARPRFRYGQTKKEVEKNEAGMFRKWLEGARGAVDDWVRGPPMEGWPRSPSWFETNLEVWRQLWRVTESSAIVLLLVDARCPPLHCPPSLRGYLRNLRPKKEVILVLTKADLVDAGALEGWKLWLQDWWVAGAAEDRERQMRRARTPATPSASTPGQSDVGSSGAGSSTAKLENSRDCAEQETSIQVVCVTSYDIELLYADGKRRHRPAIPLSARADLVAAIKRAHARLLQPPARVADDSTKLAEWRPPVRTEIDWSALAAEPEVVPKFKEKRAHRQAVDEHDEQQPISTPPTEQVTESPETEPTYERDPESEPLSIGLVGQPNVGKSSLLNALLGTTKVRASKTPGKTKHFQTILWGVKREIKIIDCPGLVCPSLVPMELQAMSGILPISQIPSLPSCIHFAASHLPLETVFRIPPPDDTAASEQRTLAAKRTWREDFFARPRTASPHADQDDILLEHQWTAGEIMEARALDRGYLTAKGGRPDANRAGNGMLRALADGRVRWGFWPPNTANELLLAAEREKNGVWLGGSPLDDDEGLGSGLKGGVEDSESEGESEDEQEGETEGEEDLDGSEDDQDDHPDQQEPKDKHKKGDDDDDDDDEEEEEDFTSANQRSFFAALSMDNPPTDDESDEDDE